MRNVMTPRKSALLIYVETKNNRSFGIVRMTVKVPPMVRANFLGLADTHLLFLRSVELKLGSHTITVRLRKCGLKSMSEHIPIDRAWILIQEASPPSVAEACHIDTCGDCREFLWGFISVARYVGFSVHFPIRDRAVDREIVHEPQNLDLTPQNTATVDNKPRPLH